MGKMSLNIFAYHIYSIASAPAPSECTLHPCDGVSVKVEIRRTPVNVDEVLLNGKYVGNRWGGIKEFCDIVCAAKPEIQYD